MINVEEKLEELRKETTYAGEFDYKDSRYIDDIILEIADESIDIYYSELDKFLTEKMDKVEEAIKEYGWEGVGSSIYGAVRMAEYTEAVEEMHNELDEIILYCALEKLQSDGVKEITEDQFNELEVYCSSADTGGYLDAVIDEAISEAFPEPDEEAEDEED